MSLFHLWSFLCVCEVLTDVAVCSEATQTAASCGNVHHRGFQASPLLQHTVFQSRQVDTVCFLWCLLYTMPSIYHTATL